MDKKEHLWFLFQFLHEVEKNMSREEEKQVMIEKAINLRLLCDYVVSCSYGDIVLIICMLHDYIRMLDKIRPDDINYQVYYRKKFIEIANRLEEQIEYDYEKQLEKCQKKITAREKNNDIGEEAMALAVKYSSKGKKSNINEDQGKKEETEAKHEGESSK